MLFLQKKKENVPHELHVEAHTQKHTKPTQWTKALESRQTPATATRHQKKNHIASMNADGNGGEKRKNCWYLVTFLFHFYF